MNDSMNNLTLYIALITVIKHYEVRLNYYRLDVTSFVP